MLKRCFVFTGVLALRLASAAQEPTEPPPARTSTELAIPFRLEAGGAPIDLVKHNGHAGPQTVDLDGDGDLDLLVGTFAGAIVQYRNDGKRAEPRLAEGVPMSASGQEIKLHNW